MCCSALCGARQVRPQHVDAALPLCDYTIVLERGRVLHAGASVTLSGDRSLLESLVTLRADGR